MVSFTLLRWRVAVLLLLVSVILWSSEAAVIFLVYHFAYFFDAVGLHVKCPHLALPTRPAPPASLARSRSWDEVVSDQLAGPHAGWIVARHPDALGLCNRILDTMSAFLLAVATNRTLWIEWEGRPQVALNSDENVGSSSFQSLFNSSFLDERYRPPAGLASVSLPAGDDCFLVRIVQSPDLNRELLAGPIVNVTRWDWWGGLLLRNPRYGQTVFRDLDVMAGFPVIFASLFRLRDPIPRPVECSWLIQVRLNLLAPWFDTAPIDTFLECATANGMTPRDYRTAWIVTDNKRKLWERASPQALRVLSLMNVPSEETSCRGACGDRRAMEIMYELSQCKRAVLSFSSSFGSCITSLAGITRVYRVGRYGDCHALGLREPYDMNTFSRHGNAASYLASGPGLS